MSFKKKTENFWYYYKWHTIIGILALVLIAYAVKTSVGSKENDLFMVYVSDKGVNAASSDMLEKDFKDSDILKDVNGDGERVFYLDNMVVSMDGANNDMALMQKLQVYMMAGEQSLMLVHKYIPEDYDGAFEDISSFASEDDVTYTGAEGKITAISVEGNSYLESLGFNTDNLYIALHTRTEKQEKNHVRDGEYKNARRALKYILDNK